MENRVEEINHVSAKLNTELYDAAFSRKRQMRLRWDEFIALALEHYLGSDAPTPAKEKPDPLDKEALAIREWLRQADTQPKGSVFRIQAEMIRKLVKIAMPEPVAEPIAAAPVTPAPDKERKHRRIGSNPTEEPA